MNYDVHCLIPLPLSLPLFLPLSLSPSVPHPLFTVLPLNTENVASVFQIVPLNKKDNDGFYSFGAWLQIPNALHSQPLKAAGWYVDEGKRCSWRLIVFSLDFCNETNVSDYLLPYYVESPAGVMSYVHIHLYVYICTCMYIYMYVYITCVRTCICTCTCTCICAKNFHLTVF